MDQPDSVAVRYGNAAEPFDLIEGKLDVASICRYFSLDFNTIKINGRVVSVDASGLMRRPIPAGMEEVVVSGLPQAAAVAPPAELHSNTNLTRIMQRISLLPETQQNTILENPLIKHVIAGPQLDTKTINAMLSIVGAKGTTTRMQQEALDKNGYMLDGAIAGQGQISSSIRLAIKDGVIKAAKVYDARCAKAANLELKTASEVHTAWSCRTLVTYEDFFEAGGYHVLIMEYYPATALKLLDFPKRQPLVIAIVAMSVLGAIMCLAGLSYCHGDIKPQNIMLTSNAGSSGGGGAAVLIDMASCTQYGSLLSECTPSYAMQHPPMASASYDLTCLASTTYQLCTGLDPPSSMKELRDNVAPYLTLSAPCDIAKLLGAKIINCLADAADNPAQEADRSVDLSPVWSQLLSIAQGHMEPGAWATLEALKPARL